MNAFIDHLIRLRWAYLALSILFIAFSFQGFKQFKFDASPRSYFEEGHPPYERFKDLEATYGRDFRVFMMISAREGDLFTQSKLKEILYSMPPKNHGYCHM